MPTEAYKRPGDYNYTSPTRKKRKTEDEKKKVAPTKVEEKPMDPYLKEFCEKFKRPEDAIQFLLQDAKMTVDEFFEKHWGKEHLIARAKEPSPELAKLFSLEFLHDIVQRSERKEVLFCPDRDYLFSRYQDGKRVDGIADYVTLSFMKHIYEVERFCMQINQPQRFQDALWAFMEKLECYLGSLVSCHAYFVPKDGSSIPLRYEDSEKFILQLTGTSEWSLYHQKPGPKIEFTDCLSLDEVGEMICEVNLNAGDVMYIPRGTIFGSGGVTDNVHLNFDTFQSMDRETFLLQTVTTVIKKQANLHQEKFRRSVPIGFLPRATAVTNADYAGLLEMLAECVRKCPDPLHRPGAMLQDFMLYRLPPFGMEKITAEERKVSPDRKIQLRNKDHFGWYVRKSRSDLDEDADDEEESQEDVDISTPEEVVVLSSLLNDKKLHMMIEARMLYLEGDAFSIGREYEPVLEKLLKADEPLEIASLNKEFEHLGIDVTVLANGLYSVGAIDVLDSEGKVPTAL